MGRPLPSSSRRSSRRSLLSHKEGLRRIRPGKEVRQPAKEMAMKASIYKQGIHQGDRVGPRGRPAVTMLLMDPCDAAHAWQADRYHTNSVSRVLNELYKSEQDSLLSADLIKNRKEGSARKNWYPSSILPDGCTDLVRNILRYRLHVVCDLCMCCGYLHHFVLGRGVPNFKIAFHTRVCAFESVSRHSGQLWMKGDSYNHFLKNRYVA